MEQEEEERKLQLKAVSELSLMISNLKSMHSSDPTGQGHESMAEKMHKHETLFQRGRAGSRDPPLSNDQS